MIIFETPRLYVRRFTELDKEDFFRLNSDLNVMRHIRPPKDYESSLAFLHENLELYQQQPMLGRWWMGEKSSGNFVGTFSLLPLKNTDERHIGYALLKEYWGMGFATESLRAGIQYTFEKAGLKKVLAITEKDNVASEKVLLKCGFTFEEEYTEEGKILLLYSLMAASGEL